MDRYQRQAMEEIEVSGPRSYGGSGSILPKSQIDNGEAEGSKDPSVKKRRRSEDYSDEDEDDEVEEEDLSKESMKTEPPGNGSLGSRLNEVSRPTMRLATTKHDFSCVA